MPLTDRLPGTSAAPVASTTGTTLRMKANEVMTIGRNRARSLDRGVDQGFVVVQATVARHIDDQNGVLGRERDQHFLSPPA